MCGFVGFLDASIHNYDSQAVLVSMNSKIAHRGPDDAGYWFDPNSGIYFGHRRLAIQDLSIAGHQPMISQDGRYTIVFNGEIYNHWSIRDKISLEKPGIIWRGHSDTETLLESISSWGIETTLREATGMFALALWDKQEGSLTFARDRFGEKPLYYGWQESALLFGSELAAIESHPKFTNILDRNALVDLLQFNSIPAPKSIFKNIFKLPPASTLTMHPSDFEHRLIPQVTKYWDAEEVAFQNKANPLDLDEAGSIEALRNVLGDAVERQLISDVPVGAFLSGGFDSTAVLTQIVERGTQRPQTFTIGHQGSENDESRIAEIVSRKLGTDHTTLHIDSQIALDTVSLMPSVYSEPFGDSSQIPTFLVSQLASKNVKVALSGDGGDELFGGYNRHNRGATEWSRIMRLSPKLRHLIAKGISSVPPRQLDRAAQFANMFLSNSRRLSGTGDKALKFSRVLNEDNPDGYYASLISDNSAARRFVIESTSEFAEIENLSSEVQLVDFQEWMMLQDTTGYLPTDILTKVDRAAMANSLETRTPFLDPSVFEFAWKLPMHQKIRGSSGKWILKQLVYSYLPEELMNRPKQGFGVPIGDWLRGPLREWAESLISSEKLSRDGFLDKDLVRQLWEHHLSGVANNQHALWNILMFQLWLQARPSQPS